jgi:hypothetical protein
MEREGGGEHCQIGKYLIKNNILFIDKIYFKNIEYIIF